MVARLGSVNSALPARRSRWQPLFPPAPALEVRHLLSKTATVGFMMRSTCSRTPQVEVRPSRFRSSNTQLVVWKIGTARAPCWGLAGPAWSCRVSNPNARPALDMALGGHRTAQKAANDRRLPRLFEQEAVGLYGAPITWSLTGLPSALSASSISRDADGGTASPS